MIQMYDLGPPATPMLRLNNFINLQVVETLNDWLLWGPADLTLASLSLQERACMVSRRICHPETNQHLELILHAMEQSNVNLRCLKLFTIFELLVEYPRRSSPNGNALMGLHHLVLDFAKLTPDMWEGTVDWDEYRLANWVLGSEELRELTVNYYPFYEQGAGLFDALNKIRWPKLHTLRLASVMPKPMFSGSYMTTKRL